MRVLVDVDSVLVDSVTPTLKVINNRIGSNFRLADIRIYNQPLYFNKWHSSIGQEMYHAFEQPGFILEMPPYPDVQKALYTLSLQHEIVITTSRLPLYDGLTKEWLHKNDLPYSDYVNTYEKNKGDVRGDILIDDYVMNAISALQSGKRVIIYSQPWNTDDYKIKQITNTPKLTSRVVRARNWIEVLSEIESYE